MGCTSSKRPPAADEDASNGRVVLELKPCTLNLHRTPPLPLASTRLDFLVVWPNTGLNEALACVGRGDGSFATYR